MARTISDITTELDTAKTGYPALAALNSPSATSIWGLLRFVVATCTQVARLPQPPALAFPMPHPLPRR